MEKELSKEELLHASDELKEESAKNKFNILKDNTGKLVNCKIVGRDTPYLGVLGDTYDFSHIILSGHTIPFIGINEAIESIALKDNGEILYKPVHSLEKYVSGNGKLVDKFRRDEWGNKITDDLMVMRERIKNGFRNRVLEKTSDERRKPAI